MIIATREDEVRFAVRRTAVHGTQSADRDASHDYMITVLEECRHWLNKAVQKIRKSPTSNPRPVSSTTCGGAVPDFAMLPVQYTAESESYDTQHGDDTRAIVASPRPPILEIGLGLDDKGAFWSLLRNRDTSALLSRGNDKAVSPVTPVSISSRGNARRHVTPGAWRSKALRLSTPTQSSFPSLSKTCKVLSLRAAGLILNWRISCVSPLCRSCCRWEMPCLSLEASSIRPSRNAVLCISLRRGWLRT